MAAAEDDDSDVILLAHQLPVDMDGPDEGRLAHLLPPRHRTPPPPPPPPFRPPPPPQAVASAEHRLSFRGWLGAPRHWDLWVAKLRPLHAPLWRRLGIHDAVLTSTYRIKPDTSLVLHLASFWSPATSTFAFPWGEATLTLHDAALIAGLPATGSPVPAPLQPEWRPDEAALNGVRLGFNRSACKKAHLSAWIKHFLTDHNDTVLEHAAFLALWLTRFVLAGQPESTMRQAVFPIAVRLARGERVALAPAVLASLYRDLRDIKAFLVAAGAAATTGNADMLSSLSLYSPLYILHLWIWERFPALRPGRENPQGDGEPMAARWHDLYRKVSPTLIREVLSSRDNFLWQLPYAASLKKYSGWVCSSDLTGNDQLRLLAHCLRPCELVGMDCIEQYLPHRVARQFGLDQDVPMDVRRANQDWVVAWQTYELEGKNVSLFMPQSEPGVTARYAHWWRQQLPHSDLHAGALSIPVESKASKRKVKKTPAAMEAEAEKVRRMKKARVSPSDKKRRLEELYDPKFSGWLAAGRSGISDAAGSSCKKGYLPKYDMESDETLLPNVGATNDDVVLLLPRTQTPSPVVFVPKKYDIINPALGDDGNSIVDVPPEISNNELEGDATAMRKEEKLNNPVDTSLDITNKPEGDMVAMKSEKETMEISVVRSVGTTDRPEEGSTVVMEFEKEATETHRIPEDDTTKVPQSGYENYTMVMELEKEAMETHNIPEDDTTKVPQLDYEKLRDEAPIEEDTKEKRCADFKDLAEKDVDDSTEVYTVKQAEGEGHNLLTEKDGDNITDALGEGYDLLVEKDSNTITDALAAEQAAGQSTSLTEKGIHGHVEEITLVEQVDGQSEGATKIATEGIPEEIVQAHEKESDNDMMIYSKNSANCETPCSSAPVQLGTMEKQCNQNVELNNQREPSSDAVAMKVGGVYDHKTMDMHEEMALTWKHDHKIIGGIQNKEISDLEQEMAPKQKQDHIIKWENKETMVSEGSHMLDSRVKSDSLKNDETHAGGGIRNQEIFGSDKVVQEMALKQKQDHIVVYENKETTELRDIHMLDSGMKPDLVILDVDGTPPAEGNLNQDISDFNKQQGMNGTQDPVTVTENNEVNISEGEDIPVCSGYQIGPAIENNKINMSEDAGIPDCSEHRIDPTGIEVNEVGSTKNLQNQELLDNKEQLAVEVGRHLGTTIENNEMNLPNEADVLVCGENQINSTGSDVIEVESTNGIQKQELLDNKEVSLPASIQDQELLDNIEDQITEKRMELEIAYESGVSLEEGYKLVDGNTCAAAVNVSVSMLNKETCTIEEAIEDKQHHEVEHVNEEMILGDTIMIDSGGLKSDATDVEVDMAGSKGGTLNQCAEVAMQEKQDQEMAGEDTNRDVVNTNALECRVKPDGAGKMTLTHETLRTTESVDIAGSKISSEDKEKAASFEEHNKAKVTGFESNQTTGMEPEVDLQLEPKNLAEVKEENLENETGRSIFKENDEVSCKDQTSACVLISSSNIDDQCEDDNGWAEESTKSYDKLASDSINTACRHPVKFGKSSNEEVKRTQNIRSMYLKDIKESLGRIRAEPSNRVQATNFGYPSRHAVQEQHSACKEIKVPWRDSGRDFGRDRALELVVTSPAEETSRWRQEQYALQILEDVQNARIAEKTRMEMEIRILKAQIASMERQVMNLDHFSEVKSRSKRH
ncbi:uncharacterized protein LOC120665261 isoform X9 [Panicum virgatum]|uniref:uncharacterized protein LOC120665261 isoform X9 n=1 Tax=Panicum virgatum TaxID=38727 RepID=UPI0019D5EDCE|nr:uncharacterized protein LOC120665261 isoform X9 [Panicum virgatum]